MCCVVWWGSSSVATRGPLFFVLLFSLSLPGLFCTYAWEKVALLVDIFAVCLCFVLFKCSCRAFKNMRVEVQMSNEMQSFKFSS